MLVSGPMGASASPRPFVVVQSDIFNDVHASLSLCPVTSVVDGSYLFRVALAESTETGLNRDAEIKVDQLQSLRRDRILRVIGMVPVTIMTQVDDALRRWLQL